MRYRISIVPTIVLLAASSVGAQQMTTARTPVTAVTGLCADRVQLIGFTAMPSRPVHGQRITVRGSVKHLCNAANASISVPWRIFVGSTVIGSGTLNLAPGAQSNISASWNAVVGTHELDAEVDPNNTLNESAHARNNNLPSGLQVHVGPDWNGWSSAITSATRDAIAEWFRAAAFRNVRIEGPAATGGTLQGPSMEQLLRSKLIARDIPSEIAQKIAQAFNDGWSPWQSSVRAAGPAWYPAFAAYPGHEARNVPNVPTPLSTMAQQPQSMATPNLIGFLQTRLGSYATGATAVLTDYAGAASACFLKQGLVPVKDVFGGGPVVSLAVAPAGSIRVPLPTPGGAPVGVVRGGTGNAAPGHLVPIPC